MARFFQRGVDAYKAQCAAGGKLIESATAITETPIYVYPPTLTEISNYSLGGSPELNLAGLIVARAKSEDNTSLFPSREDKIEAIQELCDLVSPELLHPVADEVLAAFGEEASKGGKSGEEALEHDDPAVDVLTDEDVTHHTPTVDEAVGNSSTA